MMSFRKTSPFGPSPSAKTVIQEITRATLDMGRKLPRKSCQELKERKE
jgi:hypothetical protein